MKSVEVISYFEYTVYVKNIITNKIFWLSLGILVILVAAVLFLYFPKTPRTETNPVNSPGKTEVSDIHYMIPTLDIKYIYTQEWPPVVKVTTGQYVCNVSAGTSSLPERTYQREINGVTLCANVKSEGTAGSVYSTYNYTSLKENHLVNISFVLRFSDCGNYPPQENQACTKERETFDPDSIAADIVKSTVWVN